MIKDIALPYWKECITTDENYLIGEGFKPGANPTTQDYATKLWREYIIQGLGINKGLYSLKHLHTTEVVDLLGNQAAALHNGHLSTEMVDKHYDIKSKKRKQEAVKAMGNKFA